MASKIYLLLLLLSVTVGCLAFKDPELEQCKHQCRVQQKFGEKQKRDCEKMCDEYHKMKKEREREEGRYYESEEEREEEYGESNPYVFDDEHFGERVETGEGRIRVLQRFTQRSELLRGIDNYRVSLVEANPSTFVSPSHFDAEIILFVAEGRGTITVIKEKRQSFDVECGDVFRVPSGAPFYFINKDEHQKLKIVKLLQSTSVPGSFEIFQPGGENPESFYTAFSWDLLEAAFKIPKDKLKRFFEQQKEGTIIKASREQIRSLSRPEEFIPRIWPFSEGDTERPFNLLKQDPWQSNKFGRLFEADPGEFRQLRDLNVAVAFANMTKGSMMTPHYYSKATKIAVVVDGEGGFQMACPHLSSSSGGGGRWSEREHKRTGEGTYQKIRGRLRRGVVFIIPAGHPFSVFASPNHNLQIVCFEVNAYGNTKYLLAGKDNIVNKMESVARELGFNTPGREVERMFRQQEEEFFLPGPNQQEHEWTDA
ncbi:sucrose-binding protein-like [Cucurbita pepo subsp. pepo]|uniref:sucrose-binding protein-like n=1 Tax=Cucurbita pepo subsp. pepo TaxID=3664 RepID=UPI000C9D9761|nr:sucrose-binding protein-like [Cucurbita pepo subsp. pepo]